MKFSNFHFKARLSSQIKKGESVMELHGNFKVPSKQQQIYSEIKIETTGFDLM